MTETQVAPWADAAEELSSAGCPRYVNRADGAKLVTDRFFKVSARTLEEWPVPSRLINGRAHYLVSDLLAYANNLLQSAPPPRLGGRKQKPAQPSQDVAA
jgi:hypothetical protein